MDSGTRDFRVPFGKYKGMTLDEISGDNEGLKYLDWLVDQDFVEEKFPTLKEKIEAFLADPMIARDLNAALGD